MFWDLNNLRMKAASSSDNNLHAVICQETGIVNLADPLPKHPYDRAQRRESRAPYQLGLSNNSSEEYAHIPAFTMAGNVFQPRDPFP